MVLIKKLNQSGDENYFRPNDDAYDVPVVHIENEQETTIFVQQKSLRYYRKQFTWAITAFTVGSLLILFQSPARNDFLAPGPLASNHAQILNGLGSDRCNSCHDVGNQSFWQWAVSSLQPGRNIQACQSELCMNCHKETMDSALATNPHHVEPEVLRSLDKAQFVSTSSNASNSFFSSDRIECSTCHKEHHGNRDLTLLTDQQCQTCHQQQFQSFENGHPEFTSWPQSSRQSIAFDHVSHGFKHFPANKAEFDCQMCHVDDSYSNVKGLAAYEVSCAQCHQKDIDTRSETGLKLVGLPMLDLDAIEQHGQSVGQWPENAAGDFDGKIPELMHLLLSTEEEFREIANRRGEIEFGDFDPESKTDVEDAVKISWAIKRLMYQLAVGGADALALKYARALDVDRADNRLYFLTRGIDRNVFAQAANRWFPEIVDEIHMQVGDKEQASTAQLDPLPLDDLDQQEMDDIAGMIENDAVLLHVPVTSGNDEETLIANPLKELMVGNAAQQQPQLPRAINSETNQQPTAKQQLAQKSNSSQAPTNQQRLAPSVRIPDEQLLAINPLQGKTNSREAVPKPVQVPQDRQSKDQPRAVANQSQIARDFAAELKNRKSEPARDSATEPEPNGGFDIVRRYSPGEVFVGAAAAGGWFRNDELYQISYRPAGHADEFLLNMMEMVAQVREANQSSVTAPYFKKMVSKSSVGACNDCHTVDAESSRFLVNWKASYRDPAIRSFTHFSHGPHLIQKELADCKACHQLNSELANAHTFESFDSKEVVSNFEPITKSNCVSCHHQSGAGNSCTQCHDYHVGAKVLLGE